MTGFWIAIAVLIVAIIAVSVLVGRGLKNSDKHKLSREEMMALKTSGALKHRKSNQ